MKIFPAGHNTAKGGGFMVKGISRQVIVVHSPDKKLFEQAIFILKEDAKGVTDEELMKEAKRAIRTPQASQKRYLRYYGPVWACGGAMLTGLVWLISSFF
jgi:hypothetical protein